ncbi:hemagglutinin repeat-containing protein [Vibrio pacinii]|uniref:two-partner secretion domain-containing protein n=1 Tax=Vibrio pacinii TaxID=170674 RepID=UPI000690F5F8|nr:hemagglutinin repeat-containing protein [Vibrio pacinii]
MNKSLTLGKICLTYTLCGVISLQPVLANVKVDGSSGNTNVTSAGNDVEVVNIATPNSKGLSHNKYQQFDVDPSGLILNNSTEALARSQLGGILQGNSNLNGKAAGVILNEVTGANRSQLEGYTEVFGQQANVILANPYGITCDGCGFINTPRVTLSTGTPELDNGLVSGFDVAEGSVTIEGLGLDATNQTYFDIISRTAQINADIHANDLAIITGVNQVEYQTNKTTSKQPSSGTAPALAIDSSSLGGMYAGRISLVATEEGVGVNVGNLSASQGDIVLTADGTIQLSNAVSQKSMSLTSGESIWLEQNVIAKKDINVSSQEAIHVSNATVKAGGTGDASARFVADAKILSVQGSDVVAQGNLATQVSNLSVDSNSSFGALNINLEGIETVSVSGEVASSNDLIVKGDDISIQGEGLLFAKSTDFDATNLHLDSEVRTNTFVANVDNAVNLDTNAVVKASDGFKSDSQSYHQTGNMLSNGIVEVNAETVELGGTTEAQSVQLTATLLVQNGQMLADGNVQIDSQRVEIDGKVFANNSVDIDSIDTHVSGTIEAQHDAIITSQQAVNVGNGAKIKAVNNIQVETSLLRNQGSVAANEAITIRTDNYVHDGNIRGEAAVSINTNELSIENDITVDGPLDISVNSDLSLTKNIHSNDRLQISANHLTNSGNFSSDGSIALNLLGSFDNYVDGMVVGDSVQIDATHTSNSGVFQSLNNMGLNANYLTNLGGIYSFGDMVAEVNGNIANSGALYSEGSLTLLSDSVINSNEIFAKGSIHVAKDMAGTKSSSLLNSSGVIQSREGNIEISTGILRNEMKYIAESKQETKDYRSSIPSDGSEKFVIDYLSPFAPEYEYYEQEYGGGGGGRDKKSRKHIRITGERELTFKAYQTISSLNYDGRASQILAGKSVLINANDVLNRASLMHGQNTVITANKLTNKGYSSTNETTYFDYELSRYSSPWYWDVNNPEFEYSLVRARKENNGSGDVLNSTISASNDLDINVISKFDNSVIGKQTSQSLQNKTKTPLLISVGESTGVVGFQTYSPNGVNFSDYFLPSNPNGLFVFSAKPNSKYVIETNPLLTNMDQYLGSDYFQQSVGFNPESGITFLGDAFYDTRIITQAIFEHTGQRYLNNQIGSDLSQMQQLIDAAAVQKSSLNLQVGVALSQEQIAKLTNDIVWYEPIFVDGKKVLAPKLYLAQATNERFSSIASIGADNLTITANELRNDKGSLTGGNVVSVVTDKNITNLSGVIKGGEVSLVSSSGDVINNTLTDSFSVDKHGSIVSENAQNVIYHTTDVGPKATISATEGLNLSAGDSVRSYGGDVRSENDLTLFAKDSIVFDTVEEKQYQIYKTRFGRNTTQSNSNTGNRMTSGGNLTMIAGRDINITSSQIESSDVLSLTAGNDVNVNTALNKQSDHSYRSNYTEINRSTQHQASLIEGKSVSINADNNITLSGSKVAADQTASLSAKGDVNILAVNDSQYHYDKTVSKKSFGRSKTTINETYKETVKGSSIQAGDRLTIKAQNLDAAITAGGESDINIIGSELNAGGEVELSADGDVNFAAQTFKEFERHETIKKGFGGLSGRNKGSLEDATLLNSSYVINSGNTTVTAGRDIGVIASEVSSGGDVNLNAVNDVLIAAGDVLKQAQQWDEKTSFLSGGNLFEMEKKRQGEQTSTAQASQVQSGGNLTVEAGSIQVIGSALNANNNVDLVADTSDVEILAAKETTQTTSSEEKLSIRLGDGFQGVSVEDGQLKISLGDASYDKVKDKSDALNHQGSQVVAGDHLTMEAESSILVEGSNLVADNNQDQMGDLTLAAKDNVTIKEAVDTLSEQREEIHGKAEASLIVQHQAVEVAKAAMALKQSTKKLKQAEQDYKQYKKGLDSLESTLGTLEQEYADKKPGVTFEDIEELNDLISEVKSDEAWYVAGVTLAAEDVASKTTLLVQRTAAAAQSSGTYGFNAGLHLDIEASKTKSNSQETKSVGSQLSGQNVIVRAGEQEGDQANISGSVVAANDSLKIAANEVNITSSQDTQNSKSETQSGKIGASMTVYGASSGINLNASFDRNQSTSSSVTHNNSQLNADNITITSNQETNIKGATVAANESLTVDVGGDLNVASVQDRHSSSQKGSGISGGLSLSGGSDAVQLTGGSSGINASNGRTRTKQTVLTSLNSGGSADITVANNTDMKGALIATTDENGQDNGKLNLTTGSLTFADLSNTSYNQNRSMGLNTSVGVNDGELDSTNNSTSVQYKNTSGYSKSKTLATIGQGQLTIADSENSDDTSRLNRDTEHTEKDLFTVDRKQGDIDVTVDHRLLTEGGRAQIKEDVKRTHLAGNAIADVVTDESVEVSDTFEHMDVLQKELDIQKKIALESPEAAQILNNLDLANAEAKQYATKVYIQAYAAVMGITIDEARVVAIKSGSKGSHLVQNGKTTVELNDAETANGADAANTIVHEGTHAAINQGRIGDKGKFEEQYTGLVGNYAEDTFKFVLDNYGLGEYKSGDVNQHIGNDSSPLVWLNNINSAIEHNTLGVTVDNRFLSKREYELANTLASESNGKYTAEEIRNVMRHTKAQENEKYDAGVSPYVVDASKVNDKSFVDNSDGKLIVGQDGTGKGHYIVQDMRAIPLNDSAKQYLLDKDLGYSFFKIPETNKIVIDYLTGRPIDPASGAYIRPQTVDGKTFAVSYYPCATAGCVATNSNMVKNAASDAFIDATSAKALDDAATMATYAALPARAGTVVFKTIDYVGMATSVGSAVLKEQVAKEALDFSTTKLVNIMLRDNLVPLKADKLQSYISASGILDDVNRSIPEDSKIKVFKDE